MYYTLCNTLYLYDLQALYLLVLLFLQTLVLVVHHHLLDQPCACAVGRKIATSRVIT